MQVGTSLEVHWSRPHDLSVDVQDGRRALVTARIKVSSFALQNTTSLLAGNLLLLYAHTHRRGAGTSVRTEGLYPDNWKREEQLSVYTEDVVSSSTLPFWCFALVSFHLILWSARNHHAPDTFPQMLTALTANESNIGHRFRNFVCLLPTISTLF